MKITIEKRNKETKNGIKMEKKWQEKIGFMAWTLHDFPEGSMPDSRQVERHLGLVRSDGSLKPAARVLIGEAAPPATILDWLQKLSALKSFLPALLIVILVFLVWQYLQLRAKQIRSNQE